jgi:hypothetical protein
MFSKFRLLWVGREMKAPRAHRKRNTGYFRVHLYPAHNMEHTKCLVFRMFTMCSVALSSFDTTKSAYGVLQMEQNISS